MKSSSVLWQLLLFAGASQAVDFWLRTDNSSCSEVPNCFADPTGLCAHAPDVNQYWCCLPNQAYCWGMAQTCEGSRGSSSQIFCSAYGASWCCNKQYESCTTAEGQINVCIAMEFASPVADGPASIAPSSSPITSSSSSRTSPSSSSSTFKSSPSSPSDTTGTFSETTTSGTSRVSASTQLSSSSPDTSSTGGTSNSSSISPGAAAGAAIGGLLGLLAIIAGAFVLWKRRGKKPPKIPVIPSPGELDGEEYRGGYYGNAQPKVEIQGREILLPAPRHELPGGGSVAESQA